MKINNSRKIIKDVMTPEEALECYKTMYPKEKWKYSDTLKLCYSTTGKLGSNSKKNPHLLGYTVDDIKDTRIIDIEDGIEYYGKLLGCDIKYNKEYYVFASESGLLCSAAHKNAGPDKNGILKKHVIRTNGYLQYGCVNKPATTVHRIIYKTFIGEIPAGYEIDHLNGIRTDNRVSNLRILTHRQNVILRKQPWKDKFGKDHSASIPVLQLDKITREVIAEYGSQSEAARAMGSTSQSMISLALKDPNKNAFGYKWKYKNADDINKRSVRGANTHRK